MGRPQGGFLSKLFGMIGLWFYSNNNQQKGGVGGAMEKNIP